MGTIKLSSIAEKWLWLNLKMYLMQYRTCLCDNLLKVVDGTSDNPVDRYENFFTSLENHIGLGTYTLNEATQFSNLPYINVRIEPIDLGGCNTEVVMAFDIVYAADVPAPVDTQTKYPGNSSEAVAAFRSNILNALDELMYRAFEPTDIDQSETGFWDMLRDQTLPNPAKPTDTALWKYNLVAQTDGDKTISDTRQLRTMDRNLGLVYMQVIYHIDVNKAYGDGLDCGC